MMTGILHCLPLKFYPFWKTSLTLRREKIERKDVYMGPRRGKKKKQLFYCHTFPLDNRESIAILVKRDGNHGHVQPEMIAVKTQAQLLSSVLSVHNMGRFAK